MSAVAELRSARKSFGAEPALRDVDLAVEPGEIVGLLGPNGAGKTTALALLLGLRRPDAGHARLFGVDPRDAAARRRCGATPQETGLPDTLSIQQVLAFVRAHFPEPVPLDRLVSTFGLERLLSRQAGGLSGGERRRVAVALAFAGDPELVFLDEPSAGLDVSARHALWDAIRAFAARGRTILLTTHDLAEAEALSTRIVVLVRGEIVASGPPGSIGRDSTGVVIRLRRQRLPRLQTAVRTSIDGGALVVVTDDEEALIRELVALHADLHGIEISRPGLAELLLESDR